MAVEQIIESYSGNYLTMLLLSKDHSSTQKVIFIIYVHITHIIPCIWSSILFLIFFVHFIMIGWCSPQVLNQSKYHWTIIALTKKKVRDKGYQVTCGALLDPWGVLLAFCCWINLSYLSVNPSHIKCSHTILPTLQQEFLHALQGHKIWFPFA